jgi:ring-1,2-phenylacetyl-CoA epoxidase subunit PaaD
MEYSKEHIFSILSGVSDPEIPVLSILDMGIVKDIVLKDNNQVEVMITPTYSGCPAMDAIGFDIRLALAQQGFQNAIITQVLHPAWTTDWMSEEGKRKLKEYGIAPPVSRTDSQNSRLNKLLFNNEVAVSCPRCNSTHTQLLSQFGSTACKALYQCDDCKEPFDYFKCH